MTRLLAEAVRLAFGGLITLAVIAAVDNWI